MRLTFDKAADAAYIYVKDKIEPGEVRKTVPCDLQAGEMFIDLDEHGFLLGIEILNSSKKLSEEVLQKAEPLA